MLVVECRYMATESEIPGHHNGHEVVMLTGHCLLLILPALHIVPNHEHSFALQSIESIESQEISPFRK